MSWVFVVKPAGIDGLRWLAGEPGSPGTPAAAPSGELGAVAGARPGRVAGNAGAGATPRLPPPLAILRPGDRLLARVLSAGGGSRFVRLEIGGYVVGAAAEVELAPGRLVWLEVAGRWPGRIVLRPSGPPAPGTVAARAPGDRAYAGDGSHGSYAGDRSLAGHLAAPAATQAGHAAAVTAGRWAPVASARLLLAGAGPIEVLFEVLRGDGPAGPQVPGRGHPPGTGLFSGGTGSPAGMPAPDLVATARGNQVANPPAHPAASAPGSHPAHAPADPGAGANPAGPPAPVNPGAMPAGPSPDGGSGLQGHGSLSGDAAPPGTGASTGTGQGGSAGPGPAPETGTVPAPAAGAAAPADLSDGSGGTGPGGDPAGARFAPGQAGAGEPGGRGPVVTGGRDAGTAQPAGTGRAGWEVPVADADATVGNHAGAGGPVAKDERAAAAGDRDSRLRWPRRWRLRLSFGLPSTGRWDWELAGWGERATVRLGVTPPVAEALAGDGTLQAALDGILRRAGLVPAGVSVTGAAGPGGDADHGRNRAGGDGIAAGAHGAHDVHDVHDVMTPAPGILGGPPGTGHHSPASPAHPAPGAGASGGGFDVRV